MPPAIYPNGENRAEWPELIAATLACNLGHVELKNIMTKYLGIQKEGMVPQTLGAANVS